MKLITLNTWGGRAGWPPLQSFFQKYRNTDVFCLQEIWQTTDETLIENKDPRIVNDLLNRIATELPEFQFFFRPQYRGIYGLAIFVKKSIPVEAEGDVFVFKYQGYENPTSMGNHGRNIQHISLQTQKGPLMIVNFHGLWNGQGKSDSEDRLSQSKKIAQFLEGVQTPYVLAGDFNLTPDTRSFRILTDLCPRNLIAEYGVTSTRSSFYPKPERLADYVLVSEKTKVMAFEVLPDEVSDHLALRAHLTL